MNCPVCGTKLEVTQVFQATNEAETRNMRCLACGHLDVSISFLVGRPQSRRKAYGKAAAGLARRIASGEIGPPALD